MEEAVKKLQSIENKTKENFQEATKDLMNATYEELIKLLNENNLSNHVSSVKAELSSDKLGFKIYTNDWIIVFHEFGTGIYNSNKVTTNHSWTYYNEKYTNSRGTHFFTTIGMPPKHIFYEVEESLKEVAKEYYSVALNKALKNESYQSFKESLR